MRREPGCCRGARPVIEVAAYGTEIDRQIAGALVPPVWILFEHLADDRVQVRRHLVVEPRQRLRLLVQDRIDDCGEGVAFEG